MERFFLLDKIKKFIVIILLIAVISGCSKCDLPCSYGCFCRRPAVLTSWEPWVLDYNDCLPECNSMGSHLMLPIQSLTADMFDPYQPIDPDYRLGKGDLVEISVFGEEEVSVKKAMVAPDGNIYYTVLPGVPAVGRTPEEVADELSVALGKYFVDPRVTIIPLETTLPSFKILGRVRGPGEFPIEGPITLREGIFLAGGLLSEASKDIEDDGGGYRLNVPSFDLSNSFVVRDKHRLAVDFSRLFNTADTSQNIYLKPGDYIYIAGAEYREVFVLGYALGPQRLPFVDDMTLMGAITSAGGWPTSGPYSADLCKIVIVRGSLECPRAAVVDVRKILNGQARDLFLCPGDIVYLSHKQWRTVRELVIEALYSFFDTFAISAASYYSNQWFHGNIDSGGEEDVAE